LENRHVLDAGHSWLLPYHRFRHFHFFSIILSLLFLLLFHFLKRCWLCSLSIFNLSVFFSGFGSIYLRDFLNTPPFISYTSSTFV
jgi:hypothetical protein